MGETGRACRAQARYWWHPHTLPTVRACARGRSRVLGQHQEAFKLEFRFQLYLCAKPYAGGPLLSASDRLGRGWMASAACLAVRLTLLGSALAGASPGLTAGNQGWRLLVS